MPLSDPVRAAIFLEIAGTACARTCAHFSQMSDRTIPKSTLVAAFQGVARGGPDPQRAARRRDAEHIAMRGDRGAISGPDSRDREGSEGAGGRMSIAGRLGAVALACRVQVGTL